MKNSMIKQLKEDLATLKKEKQKTNKTISSSTETQVIS